MSLDTVSLTLILCLCAWTASAVPEETLDAFSCSSGTSLDLNQEVPVDAQGLPVGGDQFIVLDSCRDLGRISVCENAY